ncbi:MAG: ribonuclease Y [Deltaproteobacteria bacterium]|nr:ribonuclease Y [Deltaproteobacteria bacterium]
MTLLGAAGAIVFFFVGIAIGYSVKKKMERSSVDGATKVASNLVSTAEKEAENIKREAVLQAKDTLYQGKQEFEKETGERKKEIQSQEKRLVQREEKLEKNYEVLERKDLDLSGREKTLGTKERDAEGRTRELDGLIEEEKRKLSDVAGLSAEEAKNLLVESIEDEAKLEAGIRLKRINDETEASAEVEAKKIMTLAIQRYAGDYVSERTVSVVNLPSDEMKGRIIGREGRNIRAIEAITGIDIIIDDTPQAVILSGHNPVRREIARQAIERLITDGRIHPARVEEVVHKVEAEIEKVIKDAGERATFDTALHGIHPEIQKLIGRLKYRTSFAQNVYAHSMEVAFICGIMAAELGIPVKQAKRAGLLHDIGKAVDHEVEGSHATIGADLAKKYGEKSPILEAIGQHHDPEPESLLAVLVQAADTLSAARPGARREMFETYIKRLDDLENIATGFSGVDKSFALQAGREIRVIVESEKISDGAATVLSRDIAKKVESELSYPGQIKVTVIRETRAVDYAK